MALASHGGSCERGCGDQCSRQKFKTGHSISPLDMKSQQRVASLWKWSRARPIKVTITHLVSTPREGARRTSGRSAAPLVSLPLVSLSFPTCAPLPNVEHGVENALDGPASAAC